MNMFIEFLHQNFGYPDGGLYSNLIASMILGILGLMYGKSFEKKAKARHQELLDSHAALHDKINELKK